MALPKPVELPLKEVGMVSTLQAFAQEDLGLCLQCPYFI
jgi:hypothetical protein